MPNKRLAVVASGWHFPSQFYEMMLKQRRAEGWDYEFFCISHRDPKHAKKEKKGREFTGDRADLDKRLYERIITKKEIEALGWTYEEHPNTIGDWGNSNQWLAGHNYKDYDLFLFTHDDNLILNDKWLRDVIEDDSFGQWEILANSLGMPKGNLRGSCEFFTRSVLEKMGGKFDLSDTTLTREGETTAGEGTEELYDWNSTVYPMARFIEANNILVGFMSPSYRVSAYCIEGERGYIGNTHGINTAEEDDGLKVLREAHLL
jgi:hypothetical protein